MSDDLDRAYYQRRIIECEERAKANPGLVRIYKEFADEYRYRIDRLPPPEPREIVI